MYINQLKYIPFMNWLKWINQFMLNNFERLIKIVYIGPIQSLYAQNGMFVLLKKQGMGTLVMQNYD